MRGWLMLPPAAVAPPPVVIVLGGFDGWREEYAVGADALLARGLACLLIDGTCWQDDELIRLGLAQKPAHDMGHLSIGGPGGSLEHLSRLPIARKIYIPINNTNPILLEDSPERCEVERAGVEVATDGLDVEVPAR